MKNFALTLGNREYKCTSSHSDATDQNWIINFNHGNVSVTVDVPLKNRMTRAKVILFIEALHEGMHQAYKEQQLDQNYIWNR